MNTADKEELDEFIAFVNAMEKNKKQPKKKTVKKTVLPKTNNHALANLVSQSLANSLAMDNGDPLAPIPEITQPPPNKKGPPPPLPNKKGPPPPPPRNRKGPPPPPRNRKPIETEPDFFGVYGHEGSVHDSTGSVTEDVFDKATKGFKQRYPHATFEGEHDGGPTVTELDDEFYGGVVSQDRMKELKAKHDDEIKDPTEIEERKKKHEELKKKDKEKEEEKEEEKEDKHVISPPKQLQINPPHFMPYVEYLQIFNFMIKGNGMTQTQYYIENIDKFKQRIDDFKKLKETLKGYELEGLEIEIKDVEKAFKFIVKKVNEKYADYGTINFD